MSIHITYIGLYGALGMEDLGSAVTQRVQSTYMVQSMASVVVISLIVWVSIPHMGT